MKIIFISGGNNYNIRFTPKQNLKFKEVKSQNILPLTVKISS